MRFSCPNFTVAVILPCLEERGMRQTYGTAEYTPENLPYWPERWTERRPQGLCMSYITPKPNVTVGALAKAVSTRLVLS